jgi:23S rRNA pseudouridine2605 synthase
VVNKPKGYVTTVTDPERRPTIMDLVRKVSARVYPVGRLDFNSEGLLLLTNDGALAERLMHASSHLPKTYVVKISGQPTTEAIERLRRGITLPPSPRPGKKAPRDAKPVKTAPAKIRLIKEAENPWYEVTLIEGRNRQIRRMFEQVGHHVEKIRRVKYGPLKLDVEPGKYRELTRSEVEKLKAAVQGKPQRKSA